MSFRKKLRVSLESQVVEDLPETDTVNLPELDNDISEDLSELEAIDDKTESLETLCLTMEAIGEATESQQTLAKLTYGQIMRNTSLESIALEEGFSLASAKESLKELGKRTMELLRELWRKMQDFFYRLFQFVDAREKQLISLRDQIKKTDLKDKVEIRSSLKLANGLALGDDNFTWESVFKASQALNEELAFYVGPYFDVMREMVRRSGPSNENARLAQLEVMKPHYGLLTKRYATVVGNGDLIGESHTLPGGYHVSFTGHDIAHGVTDEHRESTFQAVQARNRAMLFTLKKTRLRVKHNEQIPNLPETLPPIDKAQLLHLVEDAIQQLRLLSAHKANQKQFIDKVNSTYGTFIQHEMANGSDDVSTKFEHQNIIKEMGSFFVAIADWTREPITGLTTVSIRFSAAVAECAKKWSKGTVSVELESSLIPVTTA